MLFSLDWLRTYVDLPEAPAEIARRLTEAGLAVEGLETQSPDVVLDIDVTTNRPDAMNHFGLARELAVIFDRPLQRPAVAIAEATERAEAVFSVQVEAPADCPRFVARVIRGVKIQESPQWLQARLLAIGHKPINNIVDVTNFVLWETGQPLHAYDLAKLGGARLVVRRARDGELLTTLDGTERKLDSGILVIADAERPVGLGGVMGGLDSEVTAATTDILLEGAHFDRTVVRLAAKRLGLHTDASHRFERGADPEACLPAIDRAVALFVEVAGGTVLAGALDGRAEAPVERHATVDLARLDAFAGAAIPPADTRRWLAGLGFAPRDGARSGTLDVTIPSWRRFDFEPRADGTVEPQDLYEEVLRIFGFDNVPSALPALPDPDGHPLAAVSRRKRVKHHLAACGFAEAVNFAFADLAENLAFPSLRPDVRPLLLENPISERTGALRRSLLPGLVESARFNQRRGAEVVRLFEVATVFYDNPDASLPDQPEMLGLVCGGRLEGAWERPAGGGESGEIDLFDLKGVVESLAFALGVELLARPAELPSLLAGTTGGLYLPVRPAEVVGYFGRLAAEEGYPLYVAEILAEALTPETAVDLRVAAPSRFPGIGADLTLTHALAVSWAEVDAAIRAAAPADLTSWALTVRYRGQGVPAGAVNTTIHFNYNSRERSLTQEEVNAQQQGLAAELARRFGFRETA